MICNDLFSKHKESMFNAILKKSKPVYLIALYAFYCYMSDQKKSLNIKCSDEYAARMLKSDVESIKMSRIILSNLNIIYYDEEGIFLKRHNPERK